MNECTNKWTNEYGYSCIRNVYTANNVGQHIINLRTLGISFI